MSQLLLFCVYHLLSKVCYESDACEEMLLGCIFGTKAKFCLFIPGMILNMVCPPLALRSP